MPVAGERGKATEQSERSRLRRNRPLSVGSALLLLALLAFLAVGSDFALYASIADHYRRHGHIGLPLDLAAMALVLTALAVYWSIAITKELRKRASSKHAQKHDTPADQRRSTGKPP